MPESVELARREGFRDGYGEGYASGYEAGLEVNRKALEVSEEYGREGWAWLDSALRAGGWGTVFDIPKEGNDGAPISA